MARTMAGIPARTMAGIPVHTMIGIPVRILGRSPDRILGRSPDRSPDRILCRSPDRILDRSQVPILCRSRILDLDAAHKITPLARAGGVSCCRGHFQEGPLDHVRKRVLCQDSASGVGDCWSPRFRVQETAGRLDSNEREVAQKSTCKTTCPLWSLPRLVFAGSGTFPFLPAPLP